MARGPRRGGTGTAGNPVAAGRAGPYRRKRRSVRKQGEGRCSSEVPGHRCPRGVSVVGRPRRVCATSAESSRRRPAAPYAPPAREPVREGRGAAPPSRTPGVPSHASAPSARFRAVRARHQPRTRPRSRPCRHPQRPGRPHVIDLRIPHPVPPVLQLARRHSRVRRSPVGGRPRPHRTDRPQRGREVDPVEAGRGRPHPCLRHGEGVRRDRLAAAGRLPRHLPAGRPRARHRRGPRRPARHRGGRPGRGPLHGRRRRLGRGGAGPRHTRRARPAPDRPGPYGRRGLRRRVRAAAAGRAAAAPSGRAAARRADQQPGPAGAAPPVRGGRVLAGHDGRGQPRPRTAGAGRPDRRPARRRADRLRRQPVGLRGRARRRTGGGRADGAGRRGGREAPEARTRRRTGEVGPPGAVRAEDVRHQARAAGGHAGAQAPGPGVGGQAPRAAHRSAGGARERLDEALLAVRDDDEIRIDLPHTAVPAGRTVLALEQLELRYGARRRAGGARAGADRAGRAERRGQDDTAADAGGRDPARGGLA